MHCLLTRLVMQIGDAFALARNIEERRNRLRIEDMLGRWRMLTMREQEVAKMQKISKKQKYCKLLQKY